MIKVLLPMIILIAYTYEIDINNLDLQYPFTFTLSNGNILVFSSIGFFAFDSSFSSLYNYTFSTGLEISIHLKNNAPSFSQFSEEEGGFVICFIFKTIYFFDRTGKFLHSRFAEETSYIIEHEKINYNIIAYKEEELEYYYSIITYDFSKNYGVIHKFYYKINLPNDDNILIINNTYENSQEYMINSGFIGCLKMINITNDKYITCFYQYYTPNNCIGEISFEPDKNFSFSEVRKYFEMEDTSRTFEEVALTNNENYSKVYICYSSYSKSAFCLYYNIYTREFSRIYEFGSSCKNNLYSLKLYYFKKTKEFIFSCISNSVGYYSIIKFTENMNIITPEDIDDYKANCYRVLSIDILLMPQSEEYYLFSFNSCNTDSGNLKTRIYELSNYFNYTNLKSKSNQTILNDLVGITDSNEVQESTEIKQSIVVEQSTYINENYITEKIKYNQSEESNVVDTSNILKNYCIDNKKIINQGKCICDYTKGYYSINYNNSIFNEECYNNETKPKNFYLNEETKIFEICHKYCSTCNNHGDENENNCTACIHDYIFMPDINNSVNCVPKCKYYYYFSLFNFYSCTINYQCPSEARLLIRNKNKCIDSCSKDNIYKYQYSGECLQECPFNTNINKNKCEIKNKDYCSLSIFELDVAFNDLININMDLFIKNYLDEFDYTDNQVINFTNKEYSFIVYKNSSCIRQLLLTIPLIDFGNCYENIKKSYNISEYLVIGILEKYIEKKNPMTSYLLFNPKTAEILNVYEICKNETIIMRENILNISGIDPYIIQFFAEQGINIFNLSDKFYTDICQYYKSPNDKDIPLKLRLQIFFPNISLCDDGCISKGIDLTTMESICHCPFQNFSQNFLISSAIKYSETIEGIYSFISNTNIDVLFCFKEIFKINYLKRCIGGIIIIILIVIQTICVIRYYTKSQYSLKRYLLNLSSSFIQDLSISLKKNPPKKIYKEIQNKESGKSLKSRNRKYELNSNSSNKINSSKNIFLSNIESINKDKKYFSKCSNKILIQNIKNQKNYYNVYNENIEQKKEHFIKDYLSTNLNDMDFEDLIENDKRKYYDYFCQLIKDRQLIINSFFIKDNVKPRSIKIIIIIINIDFCFIINGLMFNEAYLMKIYNDEENNFFSFISRSFKNMIFIEFLIKVLNEIIEFFFIESKKIKSILIRGKNKTGKIKEDILILIRKIEKYYLIFIICCYIILIFSWIYISCFNNVYYYSRIEWMKSSIFIFIIYQILSVIIYFIETLIRFLSIKLKSERLFIISHLIN